MFSKEQYQEYVDRLASSELKVRLSRSPTTMGPGHIAEKIAETLDVKSIVNDMAEKVELALCDKEVQKSNLDEEIQLRKYIEYEELANHTNPPDLRNTAAREAYIWSQVERGYVADRSSRLGPNDPPLRPFQLSEDLSTLKSEIIELKALQRILNYRRDELMKLDSGIRLQQKTMETEVSIYGKGGRPEPTNNGDYSVAEERRAAEPSDLDDPGAIEGEEILEDFDAEPPPLV